VDSTISVDSVEGIEHVRMAMPLYAVEIAYQEIQ
jgi:hypothetical protein